MTSVNRVSRIFAVAALVVAAFALTAVSAFAVNVNLRVEGTSGTFINGPVDAQPGIVPGGTPTAYCAGDGQAQTFATPNTLTALVTAFGASNIGTSGLGTYGVQLCRINDEDTPSSGGWLVKINNKTQDNGNYNTASTVLKANDQVLVFRTTSWGEFSTSLDLKLPANAAPGQAINAVVDAYDNNDDSKTAPAGVAVSGGGASATTDASGNATLTFANSGKYLITAAKSGSVRGSAWITVDPATPAPPQVKRKVNRFVKCNSTYRKGTKKHRRCVRIVRAKQAAAKG